MKVLLDNKIYCDNTIVDENIDAGGSYYNLGSKYKTTDGKTFVYVPSKFSNIVDIFYEDGCEPDNVNESEVRGAIEMDIDWKNREYDIEALKERLEDEDYADEWEDIKKDIELYEDETKEYENLIGKIDDEYSIAINNIGLGASSYGDFNYWEVEIDVVNKTAKYSSYEEEIATDDLSWVEDFLVTAYKWFPNEKILDYIIQYKDFFNGIEIVGCGK